MTVYEAESSPISFALWDKVRLGLCKSVKEYQRMHKANGVRASFTYDLDEVSVSQIEASLDLVLIRPRDVGFHGDEVSIEHALERFQLFGLELCPAEVGLALPLQRKNFFQGQGVYVAMEPVLYSGYGYGVFQIRDLEHIVVMISEGRMGCVSTNDRFATVRPS